MPTPVPANHHKQAALIYVIVALLGIVWLRDAWVTLQQTEPVPYSELQQLLRDGRVKSARITGHRKRLRRPCDGRARNAGGLRAVAAARSRRDHESLRMSGKSNRSASALARRPARLRRGRKSIPRSDRQLTPSSPAQRDAPVGLDGG